MVLRGGTGTVCWPGDSEVPRTRKLYSEKLVWAGSTSGLPPVVSSNSLGGACQGKSLSWEEPVMGGAYWGRSLLGEEPVELRLQQWMKGLIAVYLFLHSSSSLLS